MNSKSMLVEGLTDAVGFVVGALLGYGAGYLLGLNIFDDGYSNSSIFGIVLVGLGGGAGLQAARHWRNRDKSAEDSRTP
jgi:hypothetical protein